MTDSMDRQVVHYEFRPYGSVEGGKQENTYAGEPCAKHPVAAFCPGTKICDFVGKLTF